MTNGKLFRKVMANTPGGILAETIQGMPPIFVSAGLQDTIFPIKQGANPVRQASCQVTHVHFKPSAVSTPAH
jgi:hypothetical protein